MPGTLWRARGSTTISALLAESCASSTTGRAEGRAVDLRQLFGQRDDGPGRIGIDALERAHDVVWEGQRQEASGTAELEGATTLFGGTAADFLGQIPRVITTERSVAAAAVSP